MGPQRPILFHDAGRGLHTACHQLIQQSLERIQRLVLFRIEILACNALDGFRIVDHASCFHTYRETYYLAAYGYGIIGILHPLLIA